MIEFKSPIKPRVACLLDGTIEITFTTSKYNLKALETLPNDKALTVQVKEYRTKRSYSQNSYMWVVLDLIAQKLNVSKEDIYKSFIKDYGLFEIIPIKNEAVESFKYKWGKNGIGWFCDDLGESKLNGFTKLIVYYGTSTYNAKEMARVIEAVITQAHELDISTLTPQEIAMLKNDND